MSSDTESTVCDPRLEVASEPQVPKGPGQIRRVPQLFTATARSTPVVPPQVQQLGSGGWDAKKKAECPKVQQHGCEYRCTRLHVWPRILAKTRAGTE